jgi:Fic family protein
MEHTLRLIREYQSLDLEKVIGYEKYNGYAIVHHSCTIEGSTLTDIDTQLLLDEGITPAGKPLTHSLMTKDHYAALQFVLNDCPPQVSETFIRQINARVQQHTGAAYNTPFGRVDASTGAYRKGNVMAGGSYFPSYDKVPALMRRFVQSINDAAGKACTIEEQLNVSFDAHFSLVDIHPFYDGNGRTSRLLMNVLQHKFGLPLSVVFAEDRALYYGALKETRKAGDKNIFFDFMRSRYGKYLTSEISKYNSSLLGDSAPA